MSYQVPTYDLYGENSANSPNFQLHCETIASRSSTYRWEIGLHRHEHFMQFLYISSGSGDAVLGEKTIALTPPCVIFIPPGPTHGFRFSRDIAGLVITVTAERPAVFIGQSHARVIPLGAASPDASYLHHTFHRIAEEYDAARPNRSGMLDAYLAVVDGLIRRQHASMADETFIDDAHRHVAALRELIGRHYREQMTASDYALKLGLSPTHLNRVVRKVTGMTAHDLIINRSIEEAKRALALTDASIRHISENLGFSDATYFSRCFRQRTGLSPRDYRRGQRNRPMTFP